MCGTYKTIKMNDNKILVVDLESAGFQAKGGSIVELGLVEVDLESGEITTLFDSLVREDILSAKHRESSEYNWIFQNSDLTPEMVRNAPSQHEVYPKFQAIIDQYPNGITAFNRNFDIPYLQSRGIKFGKLLPCPMLLLTGIMKLPKTKGFGYKWPKVIEAFPFLFPDVDYNEAHRGASDARDEALIVLEMYKRGWYKID